MLSPVTLPLHLDTIDPRDTAGLEREEAEEREEKLRDRLEELATQLHANRRHALLIVLHGMDASGKDGATEAIAHTVNPMAFRAHGFKAPNGEELAHDYLWRVHREMPARGGITVFNRSHYEEVTTVRINPEFLEGQGLPEDIASDPAIWQKRYRQIRDFERMLAENGTVIIKVLLHISRDEQAERLQARLDDPTKLWKHNPNDHTVREQWDDYMKAFEGMIDATSTGEAPWYVIPADRKWYRNHALREIVIATLERLTMRWPS